MSATDACKLLVHFEDGLRGRTDANSKVHIHIATAEQKVLKQNRCGFDASLVLVLKSVEPTVRGRRRRRQYVDPAMARAHPYLVRVVGKKVPIALLKLIQEAHPEALFYSVYNHEDLAEVGGGREE